MSAPQQLITKGSTSSATAMALMVTCGAITTASARNGTLLNFTKCNSILSVARLSTLGDHSREACAWLAAFATQQLGRLQPGATLVLWQATCSNIDGPNANSMNASRTSQLTQQSEWPTCTIRQGLVCHTFKPVASGNLPMCIVLHIWLHT